jgi:hypothetical protein
MMIASRGSTSATIIIAVVLIATIPMGRPTDWLVIGVLAIIAVVWITHRRGKYQERRYF